MASSNVKQKSNLNRWLYNASDGDEDENDFSLSHRQNASVQRGRKEILVCVAPTPLTVCERRLSAVDAIPPPPPPPPPPSAPLLEISSPTISTAREPSSITSQHQMVTVPQMEHQIIVASTPPRRASLGGLRRPSLTTDPRVVWEKKLAEAQLNEKAAQTQVVELQRKIVSLEGRVRAIKSGQKRTEKKGSKMTVEPQLEKTMSQRQQLEINIASTVAKIVQNKDLDAATTAKILEVVAAAVAQTLLASSTAAPAVAPPKRLPPVVPISAKASENQLAKT